MIDVGEQAISSGATTDLARRSLLLGVCASSAIAFVHAYAVSPKPPADRAQAIHSLLSELPLLAMFNGVLTINVGGEIVFEHSYGLADFEKNVEFTAQTRFKIASISKRITDATLAAVLARGEPRFGDSLSRYLLKVSGADRISLEPITHH